MFFRLVADSFGRRPRHKLLTGAALALGMGVATAALNVALNLVFGHLVKLVRHRSGPFGWWGARPR